MFLRWTLPSICHSNYFQISKDHVTCIIWKVRRMPMHCGVAFESVRLLAGGHMIRVWGNPDCLSHVPACVILFPCIKTSWKIDLRLKISNRLFVFGYTRSALFHSKTLKMGCHSSNASLITGWDIMSCPHAMYYCSWSYEIEVMI